MTIFFIKTLETVLLKSVSVNLSKFHVNKMNVLKLSLKDKSDRLTEEKFLRLNRTCQRWIGFWPEDNIWTQLPIMIICLSTFILTSLSQCKFVYTYANEYIELLTLTTPAGSYLIVWLKLFCLLSKRKALKEIIAFFKNEWING